MKRTKLIEVIALDRMLWSRVGKYLSEAISLSLITMLLFFHFSIIGRAD